MNTLLPQTPGLKGRILFADIYHGDNVRDFSRARDAGLYGLIHKVAQGTSPDPAYHRRRDMWLSQAPIAWENDDGTITHIPPLWGAYNFNTGQSVADQVNATIKLGAIDAQTLGMIDFEDNAHSQMSAAQLVEWVQRFSDATGQYPKIYSGNRIKSVNRQFSDKDRELLSRCDLVLAQYSSHESLLDYNKRPLPWVGWDKDRDTPHRLWAWQRDADGSGPDSIKTIPGIEPTGKIDEDVFDGTPVELQATWVRPVSAAA